MNKIFVDDNKKKYISVISMIKLILKATPSKKSTTNYFNGTKASWMGTINQTLEF